MAAKISDEELLDRYKAGDAKSCEILLDRYKGLVLRNAKSLFLIGGDTDDLIQEGMIGLFHAIQSYDKTAGASFYTYAGICIRSQQLKAIEASARKKNQPLNNAVPLESSEDENTPQEQNHLSTLDTNPERMLVDEEEARRIEAGIRALLSPLETQVLDLYLEGMDYHAVADKTGRDAKSIDNAMQRIRKKTRQYISQTEKPDDLS